MKTYKLLIPCLLYANLGYASCGSSFCMVNTNWDTQGIAHDSGLLMDLRYSYAKADQWREGASKRPTATPSGSGEEIENKRTINQLVNLNIDYAINRQWGVVLGLPFVMRDHSHTLDAAAGPIVQQAKFEELGDILARGLRDGDNRVGAWRVGSDLAVVGPRRGIENLGVVHKRQVVDGDHSGAGPA